MKSQHRAAVVSWAALLVAACLAGQLLWGQAQSQSTPPAQDKEAKIKEALADTLFRTETYVYKPLSRDPFKQLVVKKGEGTGETDVTSLDVSNITLTGILWGPSGRLAMVQDTQGVGYVLSVGDELIGGKVVAITDSSLIFEQGEAGQKIRFAVGLSGHTQSLRIKQ